jgi:4-amino-4-deoxy-L-arabinose transferase-like glycosyltransferase
MKFLYGVVACLVVLVGVYVAGVLQPHRWTSRSFAALSDKGIHTDGWLVDQAMVSLTGFARFGNSLELHFNPTRAGASEPPKVAISVCGGPETVFTIATAEPVRVPLSGTCVPQKVQIKGLNSFVPPEGRDQRTLSVQVLKALVSSPLGVPIVAFRSLVVAVAAVALLALCGVFASGRRVGVVGAIVGLLVSLVALVSLHVATVPLDRFTPLWLLCTGLLAGMALSLRCSAEVGEAETRAAWLMPGLIVVAGAALRFYGIDFGLPDNFHPDEVPKVNAIMRMVDQNTWNPQYFLHPSLLLYCTYFMNCLLQFIGVDGTFRETAFLAGRVVSATAGTLSIAMTYAIGRRLFSRSAGLSAAVLLAVFPLHVTCSRYLKEDALLTCVVLSCVLTTLIAVQSNRRWLLLAAGLLAGVTAGTKYSGILMAIVPGSAPWLASRSWKPDWRWFPWALTAMAIAPLGFVATTPFSLLDSQEFLKDFRAESNHMQNGHTNTIDAWSQLWMYHFWRSILPGMTTVTAVASVIGLGFLVRRPRIEGLFVVALVLLFYMPSEFVKAKPAPQPERYIMPCLPFLAIALGELARNTGRYISPRYGALVLTLIVLAPALFRTTVLASEITDDTRVQLREWMRQNIPPGSKVFMDWKPYCPRFDDGEFNIEYIPRAKILVKLDIGDLKASGYDYLILSSFFYDRYFKQPEAEPILRQRLREVFDRVPVVTQFTSKGGAYGFHNPVLTLFSLKKQDFDLLNNELLLKRQGKLENTSNDVLARAKW